MGASMPRKGEDASEGADQRWPPHSGCRCAGCEGQGHRSAVECLRETLKSEPSPALRPLQHPHAGRHRAMESSVSRVYAGCKAAYLLPLAAPIA